VARRRLPYASPTPTMFDRLLSRVAPGFAAMEAVAGGGYDAARPDNRMVDASKRRRGEWSADSSIGADLPTLHSLSSDLIRNSGTARSGVDQLVSKSIGTGLQLQSVVDRKFLGISDSVADAVESDLERLWAHWARRCDYDSRLPSFESMERVALWSVFEFGDCFALKVSDRRAGDLFAFKLQLIEAPRVCNPTNIPDAPALRQGIIFDGSGRPSGIKVASAHPWDFGAGGRGLGASAVSWSEVPFFDSKSGRRNVIHAIMPTRIGQSRGVPILAPVISNLEQITQYSRAELLAAVINSCFAVQAKTDDDSSLGLAGEVSENSALGRWGWTPQPGMVVEGLGANESIQSFTPGRPSAQFESFWVAITDEIAGAIGFPGEVLRRSFKASYSATRGALLEAYESCRIVRQYFKTVFHQECFEEVVFEAVTSGLVDLPGWQNPLAWEAWTGAEWIGPPPRQIDPLKEAQAGKALIEINASTEKAQAALLTGTDWESNRNQRRREIAEAASTAPAPAAAPPAAAPGIEKNQDVSEDDEEESPT
jgi:lambda family phage portal protein